MLNLIGLAFGIVCFLGCADRMRLINWRTTRPLIVAMYLSFALWSLLVVKDSWDESIEAYQLFGLVATVVLLAITRARWKDGAPSDVSKPAPLGEPEIQSIQ